MKKIVKLTEADLTRIVKKVIKESDKQTIKGFKPSKTNGEVLTEGIMDKIMEKFDIRKLVQSIKDTLGIEEGDSKREIMKKIHEWYLYSPDFDYVTAAAEGGLFGSLFALVMELVQRSESITSAYPKLGEDPHIKPTTFILGSIIYNIFSEYNKNRRYLKQYPDKLD